MHDNTGYISKSAKVQGSSEIVISSQVAGRIQSLPRRIGDRVSQWSLGCTMSKIRIILIIVSEMLSSPWREQDFQSIALVQISSQQQEKLSYDLNNTDNATITGSSTQIQLAKLEQDLEKAELDYQARLKSDNQTNENLITSAKNIQSDLTNYSWVIRSMRLTNSSELLINILTTFSTKIWESYLSAKNRD
jgi:hypothetical protein